MDNFEELAMKEEIMLDDDDLVDAPQPSQSDDIHTDNESCVHQQNEEETPQSALEASEGPNEFSYDAELMTALQILEDTAYLSDSDCEGFLSAESSDSEEKEKESRVHQQRKEETPQSALGPSEGANAALCDAEMTGASTSEQKPEILDDYIILPALQSREGEAASVKEEEEDNLMQPELLRVKEEADAEGEAVSVKEEEEDNLMQPELVRVKEEADAEMQSSPCAAGSSGQEEGPEPRTEAQGAGQEDDGQSERGTERKNQCKVCHKAFSTKFSLLRHMMIHSMEKPYVCETCRKSFTTRRNLDRHARIHTGDRLFKCDTCDQCFSEKSHLSLHVRVHTGERPYGCETCSKRFTSRGHLDRHARVHTGKRPFKCVTCGCCFARKDSLAVHVRIHTGEKPFMCKICGRGFTEKQTLLNHVRVHTGERPYGCQTCGKRFIGTRHLREHMINMHNHQQSKVQSSPCAAGSSGQEEGPEPRTEAQGAGQVDGGRSQRGTEPKNQCKVCHKAFKRKGHLVNHMRVHSGRRHYVCETCSKGFKSRGGLNQHARVHTGERPFKCVTCGRCFALKKNLADHIRIHTGDKPFLCEICGVCFAHESSLAYHVRLHTGERPYGCETCGKRFITKSSWRNHKCVGDKPHQKVQSSPSAAGSSGPEEGPEPRTEAQGAGQEDGGGSQRGTEPKNRCNVCLKSFSKKCHLLSHMMIHSGERPYVCETCSKGFISHAKLNKHTRVHTGERPFKCDTCGVCFADRSALGRHILIHTGDKPFTCKTCGACFAQKGALAVHVRVHTGERPFMCEMCGKRFITHSNLQRHMLRGHKHQQRNSATVSVKEEEEECLAQPEFILCTNNGDDAEEPMEQELVDPLSTIDMKLEKDINSIESILK